MYKRQVLPTGANDVYRIVDKSGKEYLFPAVKHMIQRISVEAGVIEPVSYTHLDVYKRQQQGQGQVEIDGVAH